MIATTKQKTWRRACGFPCICRCVVFLNISLQFRLLTSYFVTLLDQFLSCSVVGRTFTDAYFLSLLHRFPVYCDSVLRVLALDFAEVMPFSTFSISNLRLIILLPSINSTREKISPRVHSFIFVTFPAILHLFVNPSIPASLVDLSLPLHVLLTPVFLLPIDLFLHFFNQQTFLVHVPSVLSPSLVH